MKTENYSLLRDAYQIIDGIPDQNFRLYTWIQNDSLQDGKPDCGTIACAAGWLTLHPKMKEFGLHASGGNGLPKFRGMDGYDALALFFGVEWYEARNLFCSRSLGGDYDPDVTANLSDKDLWLARVRNFLAMKDKKGGAQ